MTSPAHDDVLARATRALREEADRDRSDGAIEAWQGMDGWHDVSREIRQAARRRRLGLVIGLQLVAALVGVGAWAAASGRLPALFSRRAPVAVEDAPGPPARHRTVHARRTTPALPSPSPSAPAEAPAATVALPLPPAAAPPPGRAPALALARRPSAPDAPAPAVVLRPLAVSPAEAAAPDPEELYRQAHRAHFVYRDHAAALALWDRYLAAGGGSLTLEARYNRAIALVRLQRREEAIAALAPFAAGEHDGYRQEEAQALLRVLGAAPPP